MSSFIKHGSTDRLPAGGQVQLVDAHCHFDFPRFDGCRDAELERARLAGLLALVIPGVRRSDWQRVRKTASIYPGLYYCLGVHPWYVNDHNESDMQALDELLSKRPDLCVGVGECGLDKIAGDLGAQWPWFEYQAELASAMSYPLIIHSVKTHDEVHGYLKRTGWSGRALIHGFSGSYQQAKKLVDLGCYIGVGGVITHKRASKTRDAIARLPVESLVLETDAPDMSPEGVVAGNNSPAHLGQIGQALAALRGTSLQVLAPVLLANVCRLYGWGTGAIGR
jgi:TatD DNase family protein